MQRRAAGDTALSPSYAPVMSTAEPGAVPAAGSSLARRPVGPLVVGVLAGVAHLVPGMFILVSGLVAPPWAVLLMALVWSVLLVTLVAMVGRRSWWTPVVPVLAAAFCLGLVLLGEDLFGWSA